MASKILQFKVELMEITPPVWRRIQLMSSTNYWEFHCAIQNSLGWLGYHLHYFDIKNVRNGKTIHIERGEGDEGDETPVQDDTPQVFATLRAMGVPMRAPEQKEHESWKAPISKYYSPGLHHYETEYVYDYGDNWKHRIFFEGELDRESGKSYPACIDGQRACPPEDCGGPHGFAELKATLRKSPNQRNREEKEKVKWLATTMNKPNYDPEFFDPSSVTFMKPWGNN